MDCAFQDVRQTPACLPQPHQHVPLLAGRQLDYAVRVRRVRVHGGVLVFQLHIVDARATAADEAARVAVAGGEPGAGEQGEGGDTVSQLGGGDIDRRKAGC